MSNVQSPVHLEITTLLEQVASLRLLTSSANFVQWREQYMQDCLIDQVRRKQLLLSAPVAQIGAYLIYGRDGRCWYVGETSEHFRIRMNRHNTRSDLTANRLLHPAEWGRIELFQVETKAQTKLIESQLYYGLVDVGTALLNPKLPARVAAQIVPVSKLTIEIGSQEPNYMVRAFALHTLELGEWILTARNLPGYRAAFAVRWAYLSQLRQQQNAI